MPNAGPIWGRMPHFLITDVNHQYDTGQSVLEFMFMLPVMIGLTVLLVRINSAIQVSIVNQRYSRAQALFLTFNSPYYPELIHQSLFANNLHNQTVLGVSQEPIPEGQANYQPTATTQNVARNARTAGGSSASGEEPDLRSQVRVRNTVTLCTRSLWLLAGGKPQSLVNNSVPSPLNEGSIFNNFCQGSLKYE
jgi:hypothetical protein